MDTMNVTQSDRYEEISFGSGTFARYSLALAMVLGIPLTFWLVGNEAVGDDKWWHYLIWFLGVFVFPWPIGFLIAGRYKKENQKKRDERSAAILEQVSLGKKTKSYSLYLRSFETTGKMSVQQLGLRLGSDDTDRDLDKIVDFEALLAEAVEPLAPLVALGSPGEQIGAGRVNSCEDSWKQDIVTLAKSAFFLLVIPSSQPGTQWEIEWVRSNKYLHKSIFVIPPKGNSRISWQKIWESIRLQFHEKGLNLPEYEKEGLLFTIGRDGEVIDSESIEGLNDPGLILPKIVSLMVRITTEQIGITKPFY